MIWKTQILRPNFNIVILSLHDLVKKEKKKKKIKSYAW